MTILSKITECCLVMGTEEVVREVAGFAAAAFTWAIIAFGAAALSPSVEPASSLAGFATSIAIAGER